MKIRASIEDSYDLHISQEIAESIQADKQYPDVYYIILDAYGRADKLMDYFGYDNSEFLDEMKARGFFVASKSRSNYSATLYSLASSLNISHLDAVPEIYTQNSVPENVWDMYLNRITTEMIINNEMQKLFRSRGYQIVNVHSWIWKTKFRDADIYVEFTNHGRDDFSSLDIKYLLNPFEQLLIDTTLFRTFTNIYQELKEAEDDLQREKVLYSFEHLPDYTKEPGSYFIFAHIFAPHFPYVFGPEGGPANNDQDEAKQYSDQVTYLNKLVLETVDQILSSSETPPIIILQGDHGPNYQEDLDNPGKEMVDMRTAMLNLYYFPEEYGDSFLYPNITPVNTFRIISNTIFETQYPMLPDESYYTKFRDSEFFEICDVFEICEDK
ncbi:MAG: LTA synthase family protein [Anaerolineaceae bacterium]|nr:LTA synthase family protein [Anaerolineaceae bacterium]